MKRRSSEKEMLTFDVTNMCGDFFNIKGRPGMQAKCIMYRPVLKPWLEEGKNGIYMAMEKGHEGNPHQVCVLQKLVCESTEKYTEYSPECNIAFGSCRSALRHLHEMMFNKPPSPQICNNFARKSIRGFFHDFMSNAIDGSILAEHDISMNFGLCRWAQYVNVLSDHTLCDPGSIVAMAGELGYLACGVDLFNLDSEVKPRVTLNRPFSCGPNIEQSPLFDHSTLQRREEFSDAQLATNSTAMEEFWYAANSHTHGRPDGEIEYSGESAGAAHAVGRVTCPPDGVTFSGSHQTYKKGFFHIPRGTKNDVQADYHQGIGRLGQTMCAKGQQPQPEGVRPSTPDFPLTDEETDFNAEGGLCSMPTQFLGTVRVGGTHRVPRWVEITEHSSKLWPEWSEYQSKCRSEMPMYIPLELLTISEVELPRSFALDKFQSIAWDSYDSIDSEWDSCEVGCAIPILENRVCGGTNGLSEFDWTLDYCHRGVQDDSGKICCRAGCNKCSEDHTAVGCASNVIKDSGRECISANDVECIVPGKGDGAVCKSDNDCKSGSCKGKCCNVGGVGDECKECGPLGGHCIKCEDGFVLEGLSCVGECECSDGCIDCDCGVCKACDSTKYFLEDGKCQLKYGDGKICKSSEECTSGGCLGGHCCKESIVHSCAECNSRGKCQMCLGGYTLCGHHEEEQGFCKKTVSTAITSFRCGTGGPDSDYPSSDGYNYCAMANNCPCSRPGCYMECQVQKTCWIGSIASKLTDYEPVFECKTGIDCEGNIPSMTPTKVPNKCIDKEVKFFYKKQKKRFLLKTCKWLLTKNKKQRKKICSKYVDYFSKKKKTYGPAEVTCQKSCDSCDACYENSKSKFFYSFTNDQPNYQTCKWLKKHKKKDQICAMDDSFDGYGPAKEICPKTCGSQVCL